MKKITLKTITLVAALSMAGAFCYAEPATPTQNNSTTTTADPAKSESAKPSENTNANTEQTQPDAVTNFERAKPNTTATTQNEEFNPGQVKEVQKIIHDYLLENPELMVQVFRKLQEQQQVQMQKKAVDAVSTNFQKIFQDTASPVAGNADANITIVEFFDYQCPHCKRMAKIVENTLKDNKNLRVVFKELPIFPGSNFAAEAALAAAKQGKYYEFHNALMGAKNPLTKHDVLEIAKRTGLDVPRLEKDMQSANIKKEIQNNLSLAETIGLAGTPAFIFQNMTDKTKSVFVPGQINEQVLQELIKKVE